jgi:hypothetical protein
MLPPAIDELEARFALWFDLGREMKRWQWKMFDCE